MWPCLFCSLDQFFPRKPPRKGSGSGPGSHLGPGPIWAWVPFGPGPDLGPGPYLTLCPIWAWVPFGAGPNLGLGPIWAQGPFSKSISSDTKTKKKTINETFPWSPSTRKSLCRYKVDMAKCSQGGAGTIESRAKPNRTLKH